MPIISLRLTDEEERLFREAAARRHLTLSAFVRQTVLLRIEGDPVSVPAADGSPGEVPAAPVIAPSPARAAKPAKSDKAKGKPSKKKKKKKA